MTKPFLLRNSKLVINIRFKKSRYRVSLQTTPTSSNPPRTREPGFNF